MILMIATIRDKDKKIIGFRLLDSDTRKTMEVTYNSVFKGIISNKAKIDNLLISNNELKGYNGSIDRYPILDEQLRITSKPALVIIEKTASGEYLCSDFKGQIEVLSEESVVGYAKTNGISNGKIVNDRVSAIEGEYSVAEIPIQQRIKDYYLKCKLTGIVPVIIDIRDENVVATILKSFTDKVIIPNFVTMIGPSAFNSHRGIRKISLPDSLLYISYWAFADSGITDIKLPNKLLEIDNLAFTENDELAEIIIPDSVYKVGKSAFAYCSQLTSVKLPTRLAEIENYTFQKCYELESINIPDSVKTIGDGAFAFCESLKTMKLPSGLSTIGGEAFEQCTGLTEINIPDSTESIGHEAFKKCINLSKVYIGKGIKQIGNNAFEKCGRNNEPTTFYVHDENAKNLLLYSGVHKNNIIVQ